SQAKLRYQLRLQRKSPFRWGFFLPEIQYSSFFCCRCGEPNATSYCATLPLCHSVISHILYSDLPRLPDSTPVHRDAAYMNACNKVSASNKKGRPRPARKDAQGVT
ncbi:hypothetical protein ABDZ57_15715, partial [Aeromonas veronii]|uniref:hypothetical protein n=1 Tax=Aeromonas veronii TaxID=654 RepID=UPI0031FE1DF2